MLPVTGTLPTVEATLFTVNSVKGAELEWIQCVNGAVTTATVQFWVTVRGIKAALTPPVPAEVGTLVDALSDKPVLRIPKDATISGRASVAGATFLISGREL